MINRRHELLVARQCKALQVDCTTIYHEPSPVKQSLLELIRLIDSIHLDKLA